MLCVHITLDGQCILPEKLYCFSTAGQLLSLNVSSAFSLITTFMQVTYFRVYGWAWKFLVAVKPVITIMIVLFVWQVYKAVQMGYSPQMFKCPFQFFFFMWCRHEREKNLHQTFSSQTLYRRGVLILCSLFISNEGEVRLHEASNSLPAGQFQPCCSWWRLG